MATQSAKQRFERFWLEFSVSDLKLRLFRFFFFGLLALDSWLQLEHAPRYGVGDFNVGHFPALDGILPIPTRLDMIVIYIVQSYLAVRIALGAATRASYGVLAAIFGVGYFISQLNSYQHHYLLFLMLFLCAWFPWPELRKPNGDEPGRSQAQNWSVRMVMVSLSIMYLYAALAKLSPQWLDGSTVSQQITGDTMRPILEKIGWSKVAHLTLVAELALAALVLWRRAWPLALAIGLPMHLIFEASGLRIGLFSYFMVATYILLIPDAWLDKARSWLGKPLAKLRKAKPEEPAAQRAPAARPALHYAVFALALGLGAMILSILPFSAWLLLAGFVSAAALIDLFDRRFAPNLARAAISHVAATLVLLLFLHTTDAARDHYRFWGGALRRLGDIPGATAAYERVVEIAPLYSSGHRHLGDLYAQQSRDDDALDHFRTAVLLDPKNAKAYVGLAKIFHEQKQGALALDAAEAALAVDAADATARRIRDFWRRSLAAPDRNGR